MSNTNIRVTFDMGPLDRFTNAVLVGLDAGNGGSGPMRDMKVSWGARYSANMRRRFDAFSQGGGDWPPLALTTLRRKLLKGVKKTKGAARKSSLRSQGEGRGAVTTLARDTKRGGQFVGFSGRSSSILVDTGVLKGALQIGVTGNLFQLIAGGIDFGFDSSAPHPTKGKGKSATIGQIAAWHNAGAPPRLPQRAILAQPDGQTVKGMQDDLTRAIARIGKGAQQGAS